MPYRNMGCSAKGTELEEEPSLESCFGGRLMLALLLMWHLGELQLQELECFSSTRVTVALMGKGDEHGLVDH